MNRVCKYLVCLILGGVTITSSAQSTDLARIEYTYFPQSDSDNSFRRFSSFLNFPIKLNDKEAYLVPGIEYRNTHLKFQDPANFHTEELERFQSFTTNLGYTFKINEKWRFGAEAGLKVASNFELNKIIGDDLIYIGALYFISTTTDERYLEPVRLILGLSYSTTSGIPFPLPVINYYKRFDPNWSYGLGVPKSNFRYIFNEKNSLQAFVTLDGFFANIQNNFPITPTDQSSIIRNAENISMTIVLGGLGYEYNFTNNLSLYLYAGYTLKNDIRLRDKNLDKVYTINETNSFYGRSGLKFSIF